MAYRILVAYCERFKMESPLSAWRSPPTLDARHQHLFKLSREMYTVKLNRRRHVLKNQCICEAVDKLHDLKKKADHRDDKFWSKVLLAAEKLDAVFVVNVVLRLSWLTDLGQLTEAIVQHVSQLETRSNANPCNIAAIILSLMFTETIHVDIVHHFLFRMPMVQNKAYEKFMLYFMAGLVHNEYFVQRMERKGHLPILQSIVPHKLEHRLFAKRYFEQAEMFDHIAFFKLGALKDCEQGAK